MKKKQKKFWSVVGMILGLVVALAIGGSFVAGSFLNVVILSWLPLIVHQVFGWLIIGFSVIGFLWGLFK